MKQNLKLFILLLLFTLPIVLMKLNIIPIGLRFPVLFIFLALIIVLAVVEKMSLQALGLRADNLRRSLLPYLLFAMVGMFAVAGLGSLLGKTMVPQFSIVVVLGSIAQEFIYRSYLLTRLRKLLGSQGWAIVVNAVLFALLHIIYPNALALLPVGFISGLAFAWMYSRYPNFFLISASHVILNFMITSYCIFTLTAQSC